MPRCFTATIRCLPAAFAVAVAAVGWGQPVRSDDKPAAPATQADKTPTAPPVVERRVPAPGAADVTPPQKTELAVLPVQNRPAADVLKTLEPFVRKRTDTHLAVDPKGNRLIVRSTPATIAALRRLLLLIDRVPPAAGGEDAAPAIPPVPPRVPVANGQPPRPNPDAVQVETDPETGVTIVRGRKEAVRRATKLLSQGLGGERNIRLRIFWFRARADKVAPLPDHLKPVVREAESLGMKNLELVAESFIRTALGGQFEVDGVREADSWQHMLSIAGEVKPRETPRQAQPFNTVPRSAPPAAGEHNIQASLSIQSRKADDKRSRSLRFEFDVALTLGRPVVVGSSPDGADSSVIVIWAQAATPVTPPSEK